MYAAKEGFHSEGGVQSKRGENLSFDAKESVSAAENTGSLCRPSGGTMHTKNNKTKLLSDLTKKMYLDVRDSPRSGL